MRAPLIVAVVLSCPAVAHAQSTACHSAEVVFVGRADRPVTFHISGEAAIERARQNVKRVEEEVAREWATLDPQTRPEREVELTVRIIKAEEELDWQQARWPAPFDVTVVPISVESGIRGVTEPTVMLLARDLPKPLEPDESYLIIGDRNDCCVVPPLPDLAHLDHLNKSIEALRIVPIASAQKEVAFLAATKSGATILGALRKHSWGHAPPASLGGTRLIFSSGGREIEAVTREDGSFAVFGIPPGRVEIRPELPSNLAITNKSALTFDVRDGVCREVSLTAAVNGRVRGRVISASSRSIQDVTMSLNGVDLTQHRLNPGVPRSSHAPRLEVRPAEDGTFEFFGVPAGTYLLTASVPQMVNGKERRLTTFYPGTPEHASAIPLTVGEATLQEGFDFVVQTE